MNEIQRRVAQSITEYMEVIDGLPPSISTGLWYRGQSDSQHRLLPGVLRDTTLTTDGRGLPIREGQVIHSGGSEVTGLDPDRMLIEFRRQARPFIEQMPANDFEWMFVAQHHGLPTRLLDWSTNALVALYFAVSGAKTVTGDGKAACREFMDPNSDEFRSDGFAVFVIDPGAINTAICDVSDPIDISEEPDRWAQYLDPMANVANAYGPICVTAPHISPRIRAQSGAFTLHGANIHPIDYYHILRKQIVKIFIPYTATRQIMNSLAKLGINRSFIYPGLDSIASDVSAAERSRHQKEKAAYFSSVEKSLAKPNAPANKSRKRK